MSGELKFPDEIYVAIRGKNKEGFPAAYAVPNENTSSAKKQKENADKWATYSVYDNVKKTHTSFNGISETISNIPISGFEIASFSSRYSTDNKVFQIKDPRGFTLEIYSDNLIDLIKSSNIVNGKIEGKKIWARTSAGKWFLAPEDERDYLNKLKPAVNRTKLRIGDRFNDYGNEKIYLGDFYVVKCAHSYDYKSHKNVITLRKYSDVKSITYSLDNNTIDDNFYAKMLYSKSSKKFTIYEENADLSNMVDFKGRTIDWENEWIIEGHPYQANAEYIRIFKTRDELDMYSVAGDPNALHEILTRKYFEQ